MLNAILILAALGVLLGGALALAAKLFAVEKDPRLDELIEILPGANCGACGRAGCKNYAESLLLGVVTPGDCPVGSEESTLEQARITGIEVKKNMKMAAFVACSGGDHTEKKYLYDGIADCRAANALNGGHMACEFGCIGFGSCVSSCRFGAISIVHGVARVDDSKCTGCMNCVHACPKHIIIPVPHYADVNIACSSHDRGGSLRKICNIGCLGCNICVKTCRFGAVSVNDNLAHIDFEKCTGCGECVEHCPRHLIYDSKLERDAT